MSFFVNGVVYIIVPVLSSTEEMINNMKRDFYSDWNSIRKSKETLVADQKYLFKVNNPISSAFNGYAWYNEKTIKEVLDNPDERWNE